MNSVRQSDLPQCRLATSSGTLTLPISAPDAEYTHTPPGAVTQILPALSHFMPSGTPGSSSERMPDAKMRSGPSVPSALTSNTRISARTVSLT